MKQPSPFRLDTGRRFPPLSRAPIVEAVIQWQATPTLPFEQAKLQDELKARFPTFDCQTLHELETAFADSPQGMELRQRSQWDGFRMTSQDQKHVCQFKPKTVVFSRLSPYETWERFTEAAKPFWNTFLELAAPVAIDRIGVRFISQVELQEGEAASAYIDTGPSPLSEIGLSSDSFFHKDSTIVPGHPYCLNLVRAIQPAQPPLTTHRSLIVDIDIVTTDTTPVESVESRLQEMRFMKNLVFFTAMKDAETKFS